MKKCKNDINMTEMFAFNFTKTGVCNILGLLSVEELTLSRSKRSHVGKTSFFVVAQQLLQVICCSNKLL